MMERYENELNRINTSEGVFVSPTKVNSTVRYSFESIYYKQSSPTFEGEVSFGDCQRIVSWNGYSKDGLADLLNKVSKAIEVLKRAQNELVKHKVLIDVAEKELEATKTKAKKKKAKKKKHGT